MRASQPKEGRFDLVVIGSGPAGEKGAAQAAYHGHSVAVVERRNPPGAGAIAVVGGVPVKALRDTAVYLSGWSRRDIYGVGISLAPDLVMDRLRARTSDVVNTMATAVRENLKRHGVEQVHGDARLGEDQTVIVRDSEGGERQLQARVILLATGSHPHHPLDVPFDDPDVHDSETVLAIKRLPERMMVVGGGPVGSEYASIFGALGVKVTLVDRGSRLLPLLDGEMSEALAQSLIRSGVRIMLGAQVESVTRDADGLVVVVDGEVLRPQVVLHAVGRAGNVEGLELAQAGVESDSRGRIRVDRNYQTAVPGIYAAGDIIGPPGLASVAMEQARVAMCHAFDIRFKDAVDPVVPTGIYTLPEAAMVGLTEEAARTAGEDVETGRALFAANARARIAGSTEGLVKLVFRASDRRLVGAHILGEEATELIHIAQALLHEGATIDEFIDTTFNFPTRADAYKYAAYDGLQRLDERAPR
ncbi:MAG TPA: Si-specific NAD(P)(+) transhydrogenase [Candidatus Dormibacteraeota bacterium]|nr:Si-specific NAD(P)(+) transhydrogenase [Candidatus Dormibacteraeota bacterium]